MHIAQQLEQSMRIIIFVGERYHLFPKLRLSRNERKKFIDTQSFLDSAGTVGRLLTALVDAGLIKSRKDLEAALVVRNELAHWFLVQRCCGDRSRLSDAMALWLLENATNKLSRALKKVRAVQEELERQADKKHAGFRDFIRSLNLKWSVGEREEYSRKTVPQP
jgi:hypothetical protein